MQTQDTPSAHHHTARYLLFAWLALFAVFAFQTWAQPTAGLVAHYRFENNADDSSGHLAHGNTVGTCSYVPGRVGQALHLTGAGYVQVNGHDDTLGLAAGMEKTLSVWARLGSYHPESNGGRTLLAKYEGFDLTDSNYYLSILANHNIAVAAKGNDWVEVAGFPLNEWHQITVVMQGGNITVYKDGMLLKAGATTLNTTVTASPLLIGAMGWWDGVPRYLWDGDIDEVRIYNRALTEVEIRELSGGGGEAMGRDWVRASESARWGAEQAQGLAAIEFNGKLWVVGGGTDSSASSSVWWSTDGATWNLATANPGWAARLGHRCLVHDGKLWVMGGGSRGSGSAILYSDVWWTQDGINWHQQANAAWRARATFAASVFNGQMYVMGGYNPTFGNLRDVWRSSDGITWQEVTPAPAWTARSWMSSALHAGKLWILGGQTSAGMVNEIWSTEDGIQWEQVPAANHWLARAGAGVVSLAGKLWILGGTTTGAAGGELNDVWSSTDGITWENVAASTPWAARYGTTLATAFDNRLWVLGGIYFRSSGWPGFPDVWWSGGGANITKLEITSGPGTVPEHSTNGFACTAEFSDGTRRDVSAEAQWSITDTWATPTDWRFEDGTNLVTGEICTPTTNITIQAIYRGQPATKEVKVMNVARFIRSLRVAEATTSSLSLNWVLEDPSGRDGVSFQVEHRKFGEDTWAGQSAGEARFTIAGLEEGTYYEVRVRAVSGGCADDWAYLEPITSTRPGIYYANEACVVYRFADLQLGRQVPESAWAFFWEQVAEAAVEKGFGLILAPLGIAVDYVTAALTPAIMAKVVGQLFTEDDSTVSVVSVVPTEDLSARAKLKVARGSDIWVMLAIDTRGKADVVDGEVYLESLSQYGNRIAPRQRLLSGQEAREKLQPGFIYVLAPKSPLSSDTVWTTLWVEGGYLATFGGHHDQLAYVVVDPSAGNVAISDVAELCMTGVVGSSNEVTAAVVSTGTLTGLPSGVYPQMALNILPDNLVFDSEAILTIRRQPNMGNFTTNTVIARNSDGWASPGLMDTLEGRCAWMF